jgi:tetratricopeptide (TPR) repeat protein
MKAPRALALCHCFTGALDFQVGRWEEGQTALEEAVKLYREVGSASGQSMSLQRLGDLLTARGHVDDAHALLSEGLVVAERASMRAHCLTRLHASMTRNRLAAADLPGATASLAEGIHESRRHGHCVTCNALVLPQAVRVELAQGNTKQAAAYAGELEAIASEFESHAWAAMASHSRGRVLLAQRKLKAAQETLERACAGFDASERRYESALCQLDLATALSKRRGKSEQQRAREIEQAARLFLTELGAHGEVAAV